MSQNCTTDPVTGCVDCPYIPPVAEVPAHLDATPLVGWNAGANSIIWRDGDHRCVWTPGGAPLGIVCGFKQARALQTRPELVVYGWFVQSLAGQTRCSVIERGIEKTSHLEMAPGDQLEIRRKNGIVSYRQNGREIYVSSIASAGVNLVNACLYVSGDSIQ